MQNTAVIQTTTKTKASFASEVKRGLSSKPKNLSSKFFYDAKGDFLFQQIMQMEEYYLTRCETEILNTAKYELLNHFASDNQPFNLVELGAGDGTKTKILIDHFLLNKALFNFMPIDISPNALGILASDLSKSFPTLQYTCMCGEYLNCLAQINKSGYSKKAILFLGSNIGNFNFADSWRFFQSIRQNMNPGDLMLTGFDLKKDPEIIAKAYNDPHGITSEFNLNLLERINRELGANFNISKFRHYPLYDPVSGEAKSYIVSLDNQKVHIESLEEDYYFEQWETIFTEISKKYSIQQIQALAETSGFQSVRNFYDSKKYFVDSLWIAN